MRVRDKRDHAIKYAVRGNVVFLSDIQVVGAVSQAKLQEVTFGVNFGEHCL